MIFEKTSSNLQSKRHNLILWDCATKTTATILLYPRLLIILIANETRSTMTKYISKEAVMLSLLSVIFRIQALLSFINYFIPLSWRRWLCNSQCVSLWENSVKHCETFHKSFFSFIFETLTSCWRATQAKTKAINVVNQVMGPPWNILCILICIFSHYDIHI